MAAVLEGIADWSCSRDGEAHRTYKLVWHIRTAYNDGPATVLQCPGLPVPGSLWNMAALLAKFIGGGGSGAVASDVDLWATCKWDSTVKYRSRSRDATPHRFWSLEQTFGTRPTKLCKEVQVQNPLLEPQKVSGTFTHSTEEASHDRFGARILSSSHEMIRGPQVEFEKSLPSVHVEQNVALLQLDLLASMANTVNRTPLWGLPPRCIKFKPGNWSRNYYGACNKYYTRALDFEVNAYKSASGVVVSGFDRDVLDEGSKVLRGHWDLALGTWVLDSVGGTPPQMPNPLNPSHFDRAMDRQNNPIRMVLDGHGTPYDPDHLKRQVASVTIVGGIDYAVGDIVTLTGGSPIQAATIKITAVASAGAFTIITAVSVQTTGAYPYVGSPPVDPPNPLLATGGAGTGASFNVTWENAPTAPGTVHVEKYGESDFLLLAIPLTF